MKRCFFVARIEKSIEINQALETVWKFITDFDKTAEITDGIERFEITSNRPFGIGSTVRQVGLVSGYTYEFDLKVTEFIENEKTMKRIGYFLFCSYSGSDGNFSLIWVCNPPTKSSNSVLVNICS